MPDLEFSCPSCGQVLEAPDDMRGEVVECPGCQQQITVPDAPSDTPKKPAAILAVGNKCPNCGEELDKDAILCVSCGYHLGLGKVIDTELE
jgi:DNA-directed RNA polymerase subunit RPC12/RpoP